MWVRAILTVIALAAGVSASAQTPAIDPRQWKADLAGQPTRILTLGSPHLSQLPVAVTPAMLGPLLDRLAAFKPDIITHEGLSGEQCAMIESSPSRYPDVYKNYCWTVEPAG